MKWRQRRRQEKRRQRRSNMKRWKGRRKMKRENRHTFQFKKREVKS